MKQVYIYDTFNRIWHWCQAFLIFFLALTGFEIHSSYTFFGYETAVAWHNIAAIALIILVVFAIFWHFTTGMWKHYIPTTKNIKEQIRYYGIGIFKNEPHPVKKTELSKLNPLQRLTYLGLKVLVIPIMLISGLFYMFFRYPQDGVVLNFGGINLETIAVFHTAGAFAVVAFVIVHIYLITTGHTLTSNLKAMITGYEDLEEDEYELEANHKMETNNN